ncbi:ribokinase [Anopheles bellator]|uniref:ribokinase n=1 Tax=Anopheles bellator TaxID=139047 RepID=UPI0026490B24|nr:ribokinase [Anopheles bellator]
MSAFKFDVLVFGSCIVDFISYVPRLPKAGETLHGTRFATGYGGKGANQCVAAARLGSRAAIVGKLGDDVWGAAYRDALAAEGIVVENVELVPGESTGIAQINVADNGDNQIVIVTGANRSLGTADVAHCQALFRQARILICQLETPLEGTIAALGAFEGISILNAAPAPDHKILVSLLALPTIFCVNEIEAAQLTGMAEVSDIAQAKVAVLRLRDMGCRTVIITLGEKGAVFAENGSTQVYHVPSTKVNKVVDTTGAGDVFIGALAHFIAQSGAALACCIFAANRVAARSVQKPGTQTSFPRLSELDLPGDDDLATLPTQWELV